MEIVGLASPRWLFLQHEHVECICLCTIMILVPNSVAARKYPTLVPIHCLTGSRSFVYKPRATSDAVLGGNALGLLDLEPCAVNW